MNLLTLFVIRELSDKEIRIVFDLSVRRFLSNYFTVGQTLKLAYLGYTSSLESDDGDICSDPDDRQRVLAAIKEGTIEKRLKRCSACLTAFYFQVEMLYRLSETLINHFNISPDELLSTTTQKIMLEVFRLVLDSVPDEIFYTDCTGHSTLKTFSSFFKGDTQETEPVFCCTM